MSQSPQDTLRNPYARLIELRAKGPVYAWPDGGAMVLSYREGVAALKDPRLGRKGIEADLRKNWGLGDRPTYVLPAMFADPPEHTRLRALTNRAFTLRTVEALAPAIEKKANEILDRIEAKDTIDLVRDIAYDLPIFTICHLLGVPQGDQENIHELALAHAAEFNAGPINDSNREVHERAHRMRGEWAERLRALATERAKSPRDDVLTALIQAREAHDKLSEYELVATMFGLLFAGHTTTTDALGSGFYWMLATGAWSQVCANRGLLEGAVEETLRYEPPVQAFARRALTDLDLFGTPIKEGKTVVVMAGAANRDPEVFPDPERFDVTRQDNRHISFGSGIHFCQGALLARMQMRIVFGQFAKRFPGISLVTEEPSWRPNNAFRGLERLDIRLR